MGSMAGGGGGGGGGGIGGIIGNITGGLGSLKEGNAAYAQGKGRQLELERQAQLAEIAGKESSAARLLNLDRSLGTIRALAGVRNLGFDSPSAMASEDEARRQAYLNINREAFNTAQKAGELRVAGLAAYQSGKVAQRMGRLAAHGQFLQAAASIGGMAAGGGG